MANTYKDQLYHSYNDMPAHYKDGFKYWYNEGELHRTAGPAVEAAGYKAWYVNGIFITSEGYPNRVVRPNNEDELPDLSKLHIV